MSRTTLVINCMAVIMLGMMARGIRVVSPLDQFLMTMAWGLLALACFQLVQRFLKEK